MRSTTLLSLFFFLFSLQVFSQPGSFYPGFSTGGILITDEGVVLDELAVFPNGKVITISPRGIFAEPYGQIDWSALVKYNSDGTPDLTFSGDGSVSFVQGPNGTEIKSLIMQADGKFLVIKKNSNAVWRFKEPDGLDPDFAGDGSFELTVPGYPASVLEAVTLDNLGRIIVTGRMISSGVTTPDRLVVARLNPDGTPDETFNFTGVRIVLETSGLFYKGVQCAADNLNRIIVSVDGFAPGPPAVHDNYITRFNENGSIDLTFGTSGRFNTSSAAGFVGTDYQNRIIMAVGADVKRLNATGQGTAQTIFSSLDINALTVQPDGKIVITGDEQANAPTHSRNLWIRRFNESGSPDQSFGTNGKVLTNFQINLSPRDIYYIDRKLYVCGMNLATIEGTANRGFIIAYDASDTKLSCPSIDTIPTDAGVCYATPNNLDPILSPSGDMSLVTYKLERGGVLIEEGQGSVSGKQFPKGKTKVIYTYTDITTQICSFDVNVADKEAPTITCPASLTVNTDAGKCYATIPVEQLGSLQILDNCSSTVTTMPVLPDGYRYDKGTTSLVWKVEDAAGNSSTCMQTVTVVDNELPVITNVSLSTYVLSPPNHKMRDVTANYTATDNCGVTTSLSVTSDEPQSGLSNADNPNDWIIVDNHHVQLRAERDPRGDGRVYTILITATDVSGNIVTTSQTVTVAHNISSPHSGAPVRVGSTVNFTGTFWDVAGNKHTAKWLIDDKTVTGIVTEPQGMKNGTVTGSYKFTAPGVYKLQMNITDQRGVTTYTNTNGDIEEIIVVYDPNGGYTYGGGYFVSPAGALINNPAATGDASFGFTVNYYKNASMPKGETQFEFKTGDLEFNALNFDYLVINGAKAQFSGTGKITGDQSGYGFIMTVIDGDINGSGTDKIRMKIYNKNNGRVIYDNQPGASDADNPVAAVGNNSTIVIAGNAQNNLGSNAETDMVMEFVPGLEVYANPNPSSGNFSLSVKSDNIKNPVIMQVMDIYGRLIEVRNVNPNSTTRIGDNYRPGVYIVKIAQDRNQKQIKLVKLSD